MSFIKNIHFRMGSPAHVSKYIDNIDRLFSTVRYPFLESAIPRSKETFSLFMAWDWANWYIDMPNAI